jgi:hypothetical protein
MKTAVFFILLVSISLARADDWTTSDGTTYKDVKVLSHDAGYVTIMDSDGGGKVPLRLLNADLQKQFGYDAAKSAACEAATTAQDKADREALAKEEEAANVARQKQLLAESQQPPPTTAPAPPAATPQPTEAASPAPAAETAQKPTMDADQRAQIQKQIDDLQTDIDFMTAQDRKVSGNILYSENGTAHGYSTGAYGEKIRDEQQQMQALQQQLNGN